jgi:germination protein M
MNRRAAILSAAISTVLVVAGCQSSGSLGTVPPLEPTPEPSLGSTEPDLTPAPSPTASPSGNPASSPVVSPTPTPAGRTIVRTYFYTSEGTEYTLRPILNVVPKTQAVAKAAVDALLAGPSGDCAHLATSIPAGTRLLGLSIRDGVATVDLSSEFGSGGSSFSENTRLGQVVYTLTQFPTVNAVRFMTDGEPVTVFDSGGTVLGGPVGRIDFVSVLPPLFIDRPACEAALGNPGRVTGTAQGVFEATFRVALIDAAGRTVAEEQVMAACMCESGAFDTTLDYDVSEGQWGTLQAWVPSAKDGRPEGVVYYPVWLTPAG